MSDPADRATPARAVRVLMVTGAYYPEVSGAGLQCRSLVQSAGGTGFEFSVITTALDRSLPKASSDDGVPVCRLPAGGIFSVLSRWVLRLPEVVRAVARADIVHLHGFSRKSCFFTLTARLLGKKVLLKMSSLGEDDPSSVRRSGSLRWRFYRMADFFLAPSPALAEAYRSSPLAADKLRQLANGVDTAKFRPADEQEKLELRRKLGLPEDGVALVSLGHFSAEKRFDLLARTWSALQGSDGEIHLWLAGENSPGAYEVDSRVVEAVHAAGSREGRPGELASPGRVGNPEDWLRAADIFVLPSVREGLPNALLEAMSCGLAVVAARLPGITDHVLSYGGDEAAGLLFEPDNERVLTAAIASLAGSGELRGVLGERARRKIVHEYRLEIVAERYRNLLRQLTGSSSD
ncbi:MAG: glycosyltransferase family 4 protein [Candidatus Glassbacteria bacterium]|nr:glycosyltransferase family 4 protein [Candidatus Glassbacteria bacterium]